jgi:formylmethanofuran--tetrahydromethanopterin N-formyltransferase
VGRTARQPVGQENPLNIGNTRIIDTYAEAFGMKFTRIIVTAHDHHWLDAALREFTGYSSSVIACDLEIGHEQSLDAQQSPDGRPGASVLAFGFSQDALAKAIPNRTGQCLMTCPSTAVYNGLRDAEKSIPVGKHIRFFGDGFQKSKRIAGRRFWRIPVMDGEFVVEDRVGVTSGVGGGNFIIQAESVEDCLASARRAVDAIRELPGVITPFPGGVARSGSKVGSRYKSLKASTSDPFCPTLRGRVHSQLLDGVNCALEIVVDGIDQQSVERAISIGIRHAAGKGILAISAGNYGGKLGKFHFHLHELIGRDVLELQR